MIIIHSKINKEIENILIKILTSPVPKKEYLKPDTR